MYEVVRRDVDTSGLPVLRDIGLDSPEALPRFRINSEHPYRDVEDPVLAFPDATKFLLMRLACDKCFDEEDGALNDRFEMADDEGSEPSSPGSPKSARGSRKMSRYSQMTNNAMNASRDYPAKAGGGLILANQHRNRLLQRMIAVSQDLVSFGFIRCGQSGHCSYCQLGAEMPPPSSSVQIQRVTEDQDPRAQTGYAPRWAYGCAREWPIFRKR